MGIVILARRQLAVCFSSIRLAQRMTASRLFLIAALLAILSGAQPVAAASTATTLVITSLSDPGSGTCDATCTLHDAITVANLNNVPATITFNVSGTIFLASILPAIAVATTIDGGGQPITVSGNSSVPVLAVNLGKALTLTSITIANGAGSSCGGISNSGTLRVMSSTFSANSASSNGGAICNNNARLTVVSSSFTGNTAGNISGQGGAIYNTGTLTVTNSTFSGNSAANGGGVHNDINGMLTVISSSFLSNTAASGAGIFNDEMLNVVGSTFLSNTAITYGGGVENLWLMNMSNSTFSGNTANSGGGIYNYHIGIYPGSGTMNLINSTLAANSASIGGGIFNSNGGVLTVTNTIIAASIAGGDCAGTVSAGRNNLIQAIGSNACSLSGANGNLIGVDPLLGTLANNGGSMLTFLLQAGSPAINAGSNIGCPSVDQRGIARPQGGTCDIGAVELLFLSHAFLPIAQR